MFAFLTALTLVSAPAPVADFPECPKSADALVAALKKVEILTDRKPQPGLLGHLLMNPKGVRVLGVEPVKIDVAYSEGVSEVIFSLPGAPVDYNARFSSASFAGTDEMRCAKEGCYWRKRTGGKPAPGMLARAITQGTITEAGVTWMICRYQTY